MMWYEEDVRTLERKIAALSYEPGIVFYGSSSIRQWESLEKDFDGFCPLNLGFGGSTLEACVWFFKRVFKSLQPKAIILYAGDNDLGDGRRPEDVFNSFKQFKSVVFERYPNIPLAFISIKPSFERWSIIDKIRSANRLIENEIANSDGNMIYIDVHEKMLYNGLPQSEFFDADGLHINESGYALWKEIILEHIENSTIKPCKAYSNLSSGPSTLDYEQRVS